MKNKIKKSMNNTTSGITLIALVITIVILIILATISINAVMGENGLIKRTEKAAEMQANAEASEKDAIDDLLYRVGVETGEIVVNPYDSDGWEVAWTCTNGTWSDQINSGTTISEEVDIVAKFYKQDNLITPPTLNFNGTEYVFKEGNAYKLVIEGDNKDMGTLMATDGSNITGGYGWQLQTAMFMSGYAETCIIPYVTEVIICDGVTNVGEYAFGGATALEKVTMGQDVDTIEAYAFAFDISLEELYIPDTVTSIGEMAFWMYPEGNCVITVASEEMAKKVNSSYYYGETVEVRVANEGNILKQEITAGDVSEHPVIYYGKEVTGYNCANNEAIEKWKIYHSDGENIYLIADNYIEYDYIPEKDGVKMTESTYRINAAYFGSDLLAKYSGSASITDADVKPWLSYLNTYGASESNNMKATAYLLDTSIWNTGFKDTSKAKYAIGAPTLDMYEKSYNARFERGIDIKVEENGYSLKFSDEADSEYSYYKWTYDYLLSNVYSEEYVSYMWLASPSARSTNDLSYVNYDGRVGVAGYGSSNLGVRPLVCLNSDVSLEKTVVNGEIVYNIK